MVVSTPSQSPSAPTPARIVVVRHAATEWSTNGRHTSRTDLPLLPDGESAARTVGERLAGLRPALVLSSPLRRALDTCRLAGFGDVVETTDLLLEMDYGEYEGLTTAQIRQIRPGWDLFSDGCPGGETIADVAERSDQLIAQLRSDPSLEGGDVLAFAHGHVLRVLTARWLGLEAAEARHFAFEPGGIAVLGWEHEWTALAGWIA
jgi:probable phosphoglycerate mutase